MANKKKKKPVSNPARGFATVSQPSKAKDQVIEESRDVDNSGSSQTTVSAQSRDNEVAPTVAPADKEIAEMSPEELERHLDYTELQNFVNEHSSRMRHDVARQVTRLHTERRQLRQQADRASLPAFSDELLELGAEAQTRYKDALTNVRVSDAHVMKSDMLLEFWTLSEVLHRLDMPRVDDALSHVCTMWKRGGLITSNDYVFGLHEAFLWYARQVSSSELRDYDTDISNSKTNVIERGLVQSKPGCSPSVNTGNKDAIVMDGPIETSEAHDAIATSEVQTFSEVGHDESDDITSDEDESSDADDDPDRLVDQWIFLQRRKFKLEQSEGQIASRVERLQKVNRRIASLERDVLFDAMAAQQQWAPILLDLRIATGKIRKGGRAKAEYPAADARMTEDDLAVSDADDLLVGMFEADEDPTAESAETLPSVTVHDLGTLSGLHPRRLLEEVSGEVLSRNGVKYTKISSSTGSTRLRLGLRWKKILNMNTIATQLLPTGVTFEFGADFWTLNMQQLATKTLVQAEAFLATLAIFLLTTCDVVSTKHLQRLPKAFRDIVSEMEDSRLEVIAKHDMEQVKVLRGLLATFEREPNESKVRDDCAPIELAERKTARRVGLQKVSPDEAKVLWGRKASSPAFMKMQATRQELPVFQYKRSILDAYQDSQIVIICADTGAGKSTQIPSYILEHLLSNGQDTQILVTQPRRISAISIARRVSAELGEEKDALGTARSFVGYAIRLESKTSAETRITFATTGVLLRMLQSSPDLDHLDCLILDEVHERTMDLDLLFIALKQLRKRRSDLKIVLMSATVDAGKFASYFDNAPVLDIPGRTFPVEVGYLEDAIEQTVDISDVTETTSTTVSPQDSEESGLDVQNADVGDLSAYSNPTRRLLAQHDHKRIDYDLIVKLAVAIATKPKYKHYSHALLIFMPGIGEIRRLHSMLVSCKTFMSNWEIHMLHSSFSTQELEQAFVVPLPGYRKIVISTNIAETGVTIPDITAVIDTCKEKVMRFDERRQLSRLTEGLIARASARQRRGRAARVREGLCFHLVTRHRFGNKMPEQPTPEMLRLSLQDPILRIKVWNLGQAEEVLSTALDPPSLKNVRRAISKLQDAGALDKTEQLTSLGLLLAKLPLDVTLGKLAIFAVLFKCLDAALVIIASFSVKSVFVEDPKGPSNGPSSRIRFARDNSDFLTTYNAYLGWKKASSTGIGQQQYCRKHHLSHYSLQQMEEQKIQLLVYLVDAKLVSLSSNEAPQLQKARTARSAQIKFEVPARLNEYSNADAVVSATIAIAVYPRIIRREGRNSYRNVFSNQVLSLAGSSVNRLMPGTSPDWLCYLEATQGKNGKLTAWHSSRVSLAILLLLLGEADFRLFSGVIELDNGRIRLSVRSWHEIAAALKIRSHMRLIIEKFLDRPDLPLTESERHWVDLFMTSISGTPQPHPYPN